WQQADSDGLPAAAGPRERPACLTGSAWTEGATREAAGEQTRRLQTAYTAEDGASPVPVPATGEAPGGGRGCRGVGGVGGERAVGGVGGVTLWVERHLFRAERSAGREEKEQSGAHPGRRKAAARGRNAASPTELPAGGGRCLKRSWRVTHRKEKGGYDAL